MGREVAFEMQPEMTQRETDRLVRIASMTALADKIFGGREKSMLWLQSANERLRRRTPLSVLRTKVGERMVKSLLWGIDEGVYS
jgi:putative toxin-antitoxin system antitoxin component (TIGR02293 family)